MISQQVFRTLDIGCQGKYDKIIYSSVSYIMSLICLTGEILQKLT